MKILIATAKHPLDSVIFTHIREFAKSEGETILGGMLYTGGRNCYNLALEIESDNEDFATKLTFAFMPSKWCETFDELPLIDTLEV